MFIYFFLSFFGRTVYNNNACLYFAIWVGTPRCGASHAGASCVYYIDIFIVMEAPRGVDFGVTEQLFSAPSPTCPPMLSDHPPQGLP